MTVRVMRILSGAEFQERNDAGMALGRWNSDVHTFPPGSAWYMPWYYDPTGATKNAMIRKVPANPQTSQFLSSHYWLQWAAKRPPICVVCPNGELWEIDRRSSNGTGWVVTGELEGDTPTITCSPSIVVDGYHGFLRDSLFTPDLEGRGPCGKARAYASRVQ